MYLENRDSKERTVSFYLILSEKEEETQDRRILFSVGEINHWAQ